MGYKNYKLPILAAELTVDTLRDILTDLKVAILPFGCTEQHGYHLPLSVDTRIEERLILEAASVAPCVVLPVQPYTNSGGTMIGTFEVTPDTDYRIARDLIDNMYKQGFRGIILESWHGGGNHLDMLEKAAYEATEKYPDIYVTLRRCSPSKTAVAMNNERVGNVHCTTVETSLAMVACPELIRHDKMVYDDRKALRDPFECPEDKFIAKKVMENEANFKAKEVIGVGGRSDDSTYEIGRKIMDEKVESLVKLINRLNELTGGGK